jgi:hypothetical protein
MEDYDPAKRTDRLPQPYRMIDKVLRNAIVGKAMEILFPSSGIEMIRNRVRETYAKAEKIGPREEDEEKKNVRHISHVNQSKYMIAKDSSSVCMCDVVSGKEIEIMKIPGDVSVLSNSIELDDQVLYAVSYICKKDEEKEKEEKEQEEIIISTKVKVYVSSKAVAELKLADNEQAKSITISTGRQREDGFYVMIHLSSQILVFAIPNLLVENNNDIMVFDAVLCIDAPAYLETSEALMSFVRRSVSSVHIFGAWKNDLIVHRYDLPVSTSIFLNHNTTTEELDEKQEEKVKSSKKREAKKKKKHLAQDDEKDDAIKSRLACFERCKDLIRKSTFMLASRISCIYVNQSGTLAAAGCENGSVSVWRDMCSVDVFISNRCHSVEISAVSICCDEYVITGANDGSICVHRLSSKSLMIARDGDGFAITSMTSISKIPLAIVGNKNGAMYVFEVDSGECVGSLVLNSQDPIDLCLENEDIVFVASRKSGAAALYPVLDLLRNLFPSVGLNVKSEIDIAKRYYLQSKPSQRRKKDTVQIRSSSTTTMTRSSTTTSFSKINAIEHLTNRLKRRDHGSSTRSNCILEEKEGTLVGEVEEEEKVKECDVVVLRSCEESKTESFRDPSVMASAFRALRNTNRETSRRLSKQRAGLLSMLKKRRRDMGKK